MNAKNDFLNKEGLRHYNQKIKAYIRDRMPAYVYSVTEDGILYLDSFSAGIRLLSSDNQIICASNEIYITTKEDI